MIIQNLFDTILLYGLRENNVLKSVVLPKTRNSGQKILILYIFQNPGHGISLNIGLLSIHRYLVKLFFTP